MRVGNRVRQVLALLDQNGPMTYRQVFVAHGEITFLAANKYLSRAVDMGLAGRNRDTYPATYTSIHGWRAKADGMETKPLVRMPGDAPIPTFGAHNPWGTHA